MKYEKKFKKGKFCVLSIKLYLLSLLSVSFPESFNVNSAAETDAACIIFFHIILGVSFHIKVKQICITFSI